MATITSSSTHQHIKAQDAAQTRVGSRTGYIDLVRLVMTILVIAVHAAVTYGSIGDWTYEDPMQDELSGILLSFVVFYSQAFFMALFFFFTGYFTPGSVDRKGWLGFWKDRLVRIGIPLVAYTWFLSRLPNYIDAVANGGYTGSFWQFFTSTVWVDPDEGPTWFLFAILLFTLAYFIISMVVKHLRVDTRWVKKIPAPNNLILAAAAVFITIGSFIVCQFMQLAEAVDIFEIFSLKLGFFPSYIVFFAAGILAYHNRWLEQLGSKIQRTWNWISAAMLIALPVLLFAGDAPNGRIDDFLGGSNWRCFLLCLWLGVSCVAFSLSLTLWARNRTRPNSWLSRLGGKNNYAVYLIHPLILVPVCYAFSFTGFIGLVKFALVMLVTVPLCYIIAAGLRVIPGLKRVL